jgi:hypothetical protein
MDTNQLAVKYAGKNAEALLDLIGDNIDSWRADVATAGANDPALLALELDTAAAVAAYIVHGFPRSTLSAVYAATDIPAELVNRLDALLLGLVSAAKSSGQFPARR